MQCTEVEHALLSETEVGSQLFIFKKKDLSWLTLSLLNISISFATNYLKIYEAPNDRINYVLEGGEEEWSVLDALKNIRQHFVFKNTSKTKIHS